MLPHLCHGTGLQDEPGCDTQPSGPAAPPAGMAFTVLAALSGMEHGYIRDRTAEGHESARTRGKAIGGTGVTDDAMPSTALHLRARDLRLRDIAAKLVLITGAKHDQHPSPAAVLRLSRDHDSRAQVTGHSLPAQRICP